MKKLTSRKVRSVKKGNVTVRKTVTVTKTYGSKKRG